MKKFSLALVKYLTFFIIFLLALIWLLSPTISHHFIEKELKLLGLTLTPQSHLRYNPFFSSLTVEDLILKKENQQVFAIKELRVEVHLHQLLFKEVYIDEFTIDGLFGQVSLIDGQTTVAGISMPTGESAGQKKNERANDKPTEDGISIQLKAPKLTIENSELMLQYNDLVLPIKINQLVLAETLADADKQSAALVLDLSVEQSKLQLTANMNMQAGKGNITSSLNVQHVDLKTISSLLPPEIERLSGKVSLQSEQEILLTDNATTIDLSTLNLSLEQFNVIKDKVLASIENQHIILNDIAIELANEQPMAISGNGELKLTNILVTNKDNDAQTVVNIADVAIADIAITTNNGLPEVSIPTVLINQLLASQDSSTEIKPLVQFGQLAINHIQASQEKTLIDTITLADLIIDAQLNSEKELENLAALNAVLPKSETPIENEKKDQTPSKVPAVKKESEVNIESEVKKPLYPFSLNEFSVVNNAIVTFNDFSVEPAYQRQFNIEQLNIGPINTRLVNQDIHTVLKGKSNEYASFDFTSNVRPFAELPFYALKGGVKEISLPAISAYIKNALKHEIKSGQLDLAMDVAIKGEQLKGSTDILLQGIEFTAANDHEVNSLKDQAAIPFTMAIDMLKDSDGNVELSVPLSGNINDPSFSGAGVMMLLVKQATMMAAKDYLLTTFVPYANVVSIAMSATDQLLKVRFKDLPYKVKETTIDNSQQAFLEQFARLMKDKADTQVTICPIATYADLELSAKVDKLSKAQVNALNEISMKRFHTFKKLMIEQYQLKSSRLLLCTPQIDSDKKSVPRLSFST
ncbi:DUF748 domain-containing protein [Colwelliaceae bacterium 6441]